jgi:proton glutamate symport protein
MFVGLIVGNYANSLFGLVDNLANAFVLLLQMTVLPYIALSLIVGIGGLTPSTAQSAIKPFILSLLTLITIVLCFILLAPMSFPNWENADFYSANTVQTTAEFDLVSLFIPSNPFNAFANGVIPSVVLFSIFFGVGLMKSASKRNALTVLASFQSSIANVSSLVMKFAPIGVFCIAYRAAFTIVPSDIDGLLVYISTALALVILLSFVVLPAIIAILTPFSYRQIITVSREAMITAFATGSFFIVIPIVVEKTQALIIQLDRSGKDLEKVPGIVVPISFSLPVGGKLLALLYTLFAAWFSGAYITQGDYVNLLVAGVPQLFGTSTLAMPYLLDLFNVPSSMFDLFVVSESIIGGRLGALLSVSFSTCLPLLVAAGIAQSITINWRKLSVNVLVLPLVSIVLFSTLRTTFSAISYQYQGYDVFIDRDFLYDSVVSRNLAQADDSVANLSPNIDVLTRIKQRGFLRVGYFRDDLPYSFHNKEGNLVGFDIEILNQLASDLGVEIEFVKIFHDQAQPLLSLGYLDITSGIPVIPNNMRDFTLTVPYSEQAIAYIVKDNRRVEFTHWEKIVNRDDLITGIPETLFYKEGIQRGFTEGKVWEISTPRLFFREEFKHIDGMLIGAAAASAWTLINPDYTVVVPKPAFSPLKMAFPIAKNDQAFELYMRNWITMKKQSEMIDRLFQYWIEGKKPTYIADTE